MMYLIDTNVCVASLRGKNPTLRVKLESIPDTEIFICSIVKAELIFGAIRSQDPEKNLKKLTDFESDFRSLPFDDDAAEVHARLREHLSRQGNLIGPHDLMIASIALANGLTLVTHNLREFERVPDLVVEDWERP
ncbi:MAG: type II toxin-antitoxin system VapC family toxin [Candidatus Omnitrophica bacterium]|nr:type II toxin-antitoxin system VapC family toxin [Candidatus Omnitrophota bacterium]